MDYIVEINGVPIHALTPNQALQHLEGMLKCPATHVVNHIPADPLVIARRDGALREALQRANLNLPDGMGVVWASRVLGVRDLKERVYGPDFMLEVMRWGAGSGIRHALVGGTPPTLEKLIGRLRIRIPDAEIVATNSPPMRSVTAESVQSDLAKLENRADIIWVGLGTPKQQMWADLARQSTSSRIISTVGAAFDFLAGVKPQAPEWMQRSGLEWLFRLGSEPRRLWTRYLFGNPIFVWSTLRSRAKRGARSFGK